MATFDVNETHKMRLGDNNGNETSAITAAELKRKSKLHVQFARLVEKAGNFEKAKGHYEKALSAIITMQNGNGRAGGKKNVDDHDAKKSDLLGRCHEECNASSDIISSADTIIVNSGVLRKETELKLREVIRREFFCSPSAEAKSLDNDYYSSGDDDDGGENVKVVKENIDDDSDSTTEICLGLGICWFKISSVIETIGDGKDTTNSLQQQKLLHAETYFLNALVQTMMKLSRELSGIRSGSSLEYIENLRSGTSSDLNKSPKNPQHQTEQPLSELLDKNLCGELETLIEMREQRSESESELKVKRPECGNVVVEKTTTVDSNPNTALGNASNATKLDKLKALLEKKNLKKKNDKVQDDDDDTDTITAQDFQKTTKTTPLAKIASHSIDKLSSQIASLLVNLSSVYMGPGDLDDGSYSEYDSITANSAANFPHKNHHDHCYTNYNLALKLCELSLKFEGMMDVKSVVVEIGNMEERQGEAARMLLLLSKLRKNREAVMQRSNLLRILGMKESAITDIWNRILLDERLLSNQNLLQSNQFGRYYNPRVLGQGKTSDEEYYAKGIDVKTLVKAVIATRNGVAKKRVAFVSVLWGTKIYNADYVKKLYAGIEKNLSTKCKNENEIEFICFTNNEEVGEEYCHSNIHCDETKSPSDNHDDVATSKKQQGQKQLRIKRLPLSEKFFNWWGKAYLFKNETLKQNFNQIIFLDLDQIIVGNIDFLVDYDGAFMLLNTDTLKCELTMKGCGSYNSSVLVWKPEVVLVEEGPKCVNNSETTHDDKIQNCGPVWDRLGFSLQNAQTTSSSSFFQTVTRYCHRFDHWLEMNVKNADFVQEEFGIGKVVDYWEYNGRNPNNPLPSPDAIEDTNTTIRTHTTNTTTTTSTTKTTAIVTFPRNPKPHEVVDQVDWVRKYWTFGD